MKVLVENAHVSVRSGTAKSGRDYTLRTQEAWLKGDFVAGRIELTLADDQEPYSPGVYTVDFERSVELGQYGNVNLSRRLRLNLEKSAAGLPRAVAG